MRNDLEHIAHSHRNHRIPPWIRMGEVQMGLRIFHKF